MQAGGQSLLQGRCGGIEEVVDRHRSAAVIADGGELAGAIHDATAALERCVIWTVVGVAGTEMSVTANRVSVLLAVTVTTTDMSCLVFSRAAEVRAFFHPGHGDATSRRA